MKLYLTSWLRPDQHNIFSQSGIDSLVSAKLGDLDLPVHLIDNLEISTECETHELREVGQSVGEQAVTSARYILKLDIEIEGVELSDPCYPEEQEEQGKEEEPAEYVVSPRRLRIRKQEGV